MSAKYVCVCMCVCVYVCLICVLSPGYIQPIQSSRVVNRPGRDSGNASHGGKGETRVLLVQVSATWLMADHFLVQGFWSKNGVRYPVDIPWPPMIRLHWGTRWDGNQIAPHGPVFNPTWLQVCAARIWHDMAWWKIVWLEAMANRDFHVRLYILYTGGLPNTMTHGFSTSHSYTAWVLETNRQAGCWLWRGSGWWWGSLPRALQMSLGLERRLWHHWSG